MPRHRPGRRNRRRRPGIGTPARVSRTPRPAIPDISREFLRRRAWRHPAHRLLPPSVNDYPSLAHRARGAMHVHVRLAPGGRVSCVGHASREGADAVRLRRVANGAGIATELRPGRHTDTRRLSVVRHPGRTRPFRRRALRCLRSVEHQGPGPQQCQRSHRRPGRHAMDRDVQRPDPSEVRSLHQRRRRPGVR